MSTLTLIKTKRSKPRVNCLYSSSWINDNYEKVKHNNYQSIKADKIKISVTNILDRIISREKISKN